MRTKRESLQVIHDILHAIRDRNGTIRPTHIMYKANLSHQMLKEYLADLQAKGFIEENKGRAGTTYSLTQKGFDYVRDFEVIARFMRSFGLDETQE
jgi:predicted transcriptional regulator